MHDSTPDNTVRIDKAIKCESKSRSSSIRSVKVGNVSIGGDCAVVIAGPCSVESREQVIATALSVSRSGAAILRGGAFKPRTSPFDFQGLGKPGLALLREAGDLVGLPIVTEVMSEYDVSIVSDYADMVQVGARNMQNFALLKKLAKCSRPVLLKRSPSATIKEWLSAADYLLDGGNNDVVLCERGIRTFDTSLRNTFDLAGIAFVKEVSDFPVIADPSHATGRRSVIAACARAAIAIGADGIMVEVHPKPDEALSDGPQSLTFADFSDLMAGLKAPLRSLQPATLRH
ncbi:MAG: 3-deoxy-7-phosphoheptulonate synthase [Blastocatellia bacterium]